MYVLRQKPICTHILGDFISMMIFLLPWHEREFSTKIITPIKLIENISAFSETTNFDNPSSNSHTYICRLMICIRDIYLLYFSSLYLTHLIYIYTTHFAHSFDGGRQLKLIFCLYIMYAYGHVPLSVKAYHVMIHHISKD